MKYIITFAGTSGARFTCETFPYDDRSAEQNLVSCINYHVDLGCRLESICTAPITGDEEPCDPDI